MPIYPPLDERGTPFSTRTEFSLPRVLLSRVLTARRPPGPGFQGSALPSFDSVPHHDASLTSLIGRGRHGQALVPPIGTPELLDETKPTTSNTPRNFFFFEPTTQNLHEGRPEQGLRKKSHISPGRSKPNFFLFSAHVFPPLLKFDFRVSFRVSRATAQKKPAFPKGGESLLRVTLVRTRQGLAFVCKDDNNKTTKRRWKWAAATVFRTPRT